MVLPIFFNVFLGLMLILSRGIVLLKLDSTRLCHCYGFETLPLVKKPSVVVHTNICLQIFYFPLLTLATLARTCQLPTPYDSPWRRVARPFGGSAISTTQGTQSCMQRFELQSLLDSQDQRKDKEPQRTHR
jgi:hypothetical protein